ncbi:MAG: hypothetical protein ABI218_02730, partial [Caldimonas sp.]
MLAVIAAIVLYSLSGALPDGAHAIEWVVKKGLKQPLGPLAVRRAGARDQAAASSTSTNSSPLA